VDSWPPSKIRAVPKYMARSAMIGAVASTTIENDRPTSSGIPLAAMVTRDAGGTSTILVKGVEPSRRNVSVTVEAAAPEFASST
jgi:hypothetical protein